MSSISAAESEKQAQCYKALLRLSGSLASGLPDDLARTRITAESEEVLSELVKEGAKFSSGGVLTKHILQQLTRNERTHRMHTLSPTAKGAR